MSKAKEGHQRKTQMLLGNLKQKEKELLALAKEHDGLNEEARKKLKDKEDEVKKLQETITSLEVQQAKAKESEVEVRMLIDANYYPALCTLPIV